MTLNPSAETEMVSGPAHIGADNLIPYGLDEYLDFSIVNSCVGYQPLKIVLVIKFFKFSGGQKCVLGVYTFIISMFQMIQ